MHNILIIGAGQLGSRHLQGILQSNNALNITVVDPSSKSLEVAKNRADEINNITSGTIVSYRQQLPEGDAVDVCIIATTADIRYSVTKELLSKNHVKHIIFEKVLFQKTEEYEAVNELLEAGNTQGWVNCPRRMYPTYQHLKELLSQESTIDMDVSGSDWGLACNSVHFLDLYAYLTDHAEYKFTEQSLDKKIVSSKRSGFYEVTGALQGTGKKGCFKIQCQENEPEDMVIRLTSPNYDILVNETEGYYTCLEGGDLMKETHAPRYQSQLSGENVDELIKTGISSLTTYKDSCSLHIPFITLIKEHIESSLGQHLVACPIT